MKILTKTFPALIMLMLSGCGSFVSRMVRDQEVEVQTFHSDDTGSRQNMPASFFLSMKEAYNDFGRKKEN